MSSVHTPAAGGAGAGESAGAVAVVGPSAESVRAGCRYGSAVLPPSELPDVPPYDPSLELSTGAMCLYPGTDSSGETLRSDSITHADVHAFRSLCLFWRRLTKATNRARAMGAVVRLEKQAEADAPDRVSKVLAAANRLRALQDSTAGEWSCCKSTQLTLWLAKVRKEVVNRRAAVSKYQSCAKRLGGFPGGMKKAVAGMRAAGRSEEAIAKMVAAKTTKLQEFKELEDKLRAVRDADPVYQDFVFVKQALADLAADFGWDEPLEACDASGDGEARQLSGQAFEARAATEALPCICKALGLRSEDVVVVPNVQVGQMAKKKNRAARFAPAGEIDMMVVRKCGVEHEHSETCHVVEAVVECKRSDSDLGHALGQYKHHFLALRTPDSPVLFKFKFPGEKQVQHFPAAGPQFALFRGGGSGGPAGGGDDESKGDGSPDVSGDLDGSLPAVYPAVPIECLRRFFIVTLEPAKDDGVSKWFGLCDSGVGERLSDMVWTTHDPTFSNSERLKRLLLVMRSSAKDIINAFQAERMLAAAGLHDRIVRVPRQQAMETRQ